MMKTLLLICWLLWSFADAKIGGGQPDSSGIDHVSLLETALSRCQMMMKPLKDGAVELEDKLAKCEKDASDFKEQVELDQNELNDLRKRTRTFEDGITDRESNIGVLNHRIEAMQNNITQLIALGQKFRSKNKNLKREIENALALLEYEKSHTAELAEELTDKNQTIMALEEQVAKLQESKLVEDNKVLRQRRAELEEELIETETKRGTLAEEVESLKESIEEKDSVIQDLRTENKEFKEEVAKLRKELKELETSKESLQEQRDKFSSELEVSNSKLKESQRRVQELSSEKSNVEHEVTELSAKREAAIRESENLQKMFLQYKEKVDDPALFDYFMKKAEWLKHPHVEGVDTAYEKTLRLLGPKLHPTHVALLEMQSLLHASTEKLGIDTDTSHYSPFVSGFLTYGILIVPLLISTCLLVRLKRCISLTKATMLMTLYNTIFCWMLFATSFMVDTDEPIHAFRRSNEQAFEFIQLLIPIYYMVYLCFTFLLTIKYGFTSRCRSTFRLLVMIVTPYIVMYHYYISVWLPAMRDEAPTITHDHWAYYGAAFFLQFMLITCHSAYGNKNEENGAGTSWSTLLRRNSSASSLSLPLIRANHKKDDDAEDDNDPHSSGSSYGDEDDSQHEIVHSNDDDYDDEEAVKRKAPRHGHKVAKALRAKSDENPMINVSADIMGPEEVVEKVTQSADKVKQKAKAFAKSLQTGKPMAEIEEEEQQKQNRSKKKSKRKKSSSVTRNRSIDTNGEDSDTLENRKID